MCSDDIHPRGSEFGSPENGLMVCLGRRRRRSAEEKGLNVYATTPVVAMVSLASTDIQVRCVVVKTGRWVYFRQIDRVLVQRCPQRFRIRRRASLDHYRFARWLRPHHYSLSAAAVGQSFDVTHVSLCLSQRWGERGRGVRCDKELFSGLVPSG